MLGITLLTLAVALAASAAASVAVAPTGEGRLILGTERERVAAAHPLPRAGYDGAGGRRYSTVGWAVTLALLAVEFINLKMGLIRGPERN